MALAISVFALLATFYQLYLQRAHNEKSLKPLPQIDFFDRGKVIYIHVQNNGVGPLIIESLSFTRNGEAYSDIEACLDLCPRSYMHMQITSSSKKVVLPGEFLEVFSTRFGDYAGEVEMNNVRRQLASLHLMATGRDIYDNEIVVEREFDWFCRHQQE
ncbi:hypothetical protein MUK70_19010 [Dyadobacter chenwenxiniae]|uniref:Uncharacterized protein n=1 Tax=Dyadobacter chenwenxiniae TaxID=2906456 RepID=A0A9X1TCY6_9BACT|nr:hypothetical protein [Dyadobacter chenwenxiniae]MCF0061331.1 hypothetical protein [Dyadobacter chenwenxiniae]UON81153.1 hypothetical protein MUK70_19010 [Dyadobacter chenwenxiniae]